MFKLEEIPKKKILKWAGWSAFIILIAYLFFNVLTKKNELSTYGIQTEAIITSYEWGTKGMKNIEFKFEVDNEMIIGYGQVSSLPCGIESIDCLGTSIKITYSSRNPEIYELVLGEGYY